MPEKSFLPYYHKIFRTKSNLIDKVTDEIREKAQDLIDTMLNKENIVGLAANQIGYSERIIVIKDGTFGTIMLNPEITFSSSENSEEEEGNPIFGYKVKVFTAKISRPTSIEVKFMNLDEQIITIKSENLNARIISHEIDHLNGVLFPDHLSKLKRDLFYKKVNNLWKENWQ